MKKVLLYVTLILVLVLCMMAMMSTIAFAAGEEGTPPVPNEFFSWSLLGTYAGCLAATLLLTQMLKGVWRSSWPTQILSYIIAFVTLIGANLILGTLTWDSGTICVFNAAVISLAANGTFNNIKEISNTKTN